MRVYISIENEKATNFENQFLELFEGEQYTVRERDFMTDFIFEDCTEEEEETFNHFAQEFNKQN